MQLHFQPWFSMILELGNYKATHFLRIQKHLLINISFAYTKQPSPARPSVNFALTNGWKTTSLTGDLLQAAILDSPQKFTDTCVLIKVYSSINVHIVMNKNPNNIKCILKCLLSLSFLQMDCIGCTGSLLLHTKKEPV